MVSEFIVQADLTRRAWSTVRAAERRLREFSKQALAARARHFSAWQSGADTMKVSCSTLNLLRITLELF